MKKITDGPIDIFKEESKPKDTSDLSHSDLDINKLYNYVSIEFRIL